MKLLSGLDTCGNELLNMMPAGYTSSKPIVNVIDKQTGKTKDTYQVVVSPQITYRNQDTLRLSLLNCEKRETKIHSHLLLNSERGMKKGKVYYNFTEAKKNSISHRTCLLLIVNFRGVWLDLCKNLLSCPTFNKQIWSHSYLKYLFSSKRNIIHFFVFTRLYGILQHVIFLKYTKNSLRT